MWIIFYRTIAQKKEFQTFRQHYFAELCSRRRNCRHFVNNIFQNYRAEEEKYQTFREQYFKELKNFCFCSIVLQNIVHEMCAVQEEIAQHTFREQYFEQIYWTEAEIADMSLTIFCRTIEYKEKLQTFCEQYLQNHVEEEGFADISRTIFCRTIGFKIKENALLFFYCNNIFFSCLEWTHNLERTFIIVAPWIQNRVILYGF